MSRIKKINSLDIILNAITKSSYSDLGSTSNYPQVQASIFSVYGGSEVISNISADDDEEIQNEMRNRISPFTLSFSNKQMEESFREFYKNDYQSTTYYMRRYRIFMFALVAIQIWSLSILLVYNPYNFYKIFSLTIEEFVLVISSCLIAILTIFETISFSWVFKRYGTLCRLSFFVFNAMIVILAMYIGELAANEKPKNYTIEAHEELNGVMGIVAVTIYPYVWVFSGVLVSKLLPISIIIFIINIIQPFISIAPSDSAQFFQIISITIIWLYSMHTGYSLERGIRKYYFMTSHLLYEDSRIRIEKENRESLLYSLLPKRIADRVKENIQPKNRNKKPDIIAEKWSNATVMFVRIIGLDHKQYQLEKEVEILGQIFSHFDAYLDIAFGGLVEKIKTSGEVVIYCGGIGGDKENQDTEISFGSNEMIQLGHALMQLLQYFNEIHGHKFSIRIGISSGPIISGVIGSKRPMYDIWGDTVNIASRMETYGAEWSIHFPEFVYKSLPDEISHTCRLRGDIPIKGKGLMTTYLFQPKKSPSSRSLWHPEDVNRTISTSVLDVSFVKITELMNHNIEKFASFFQSKTPEAIYYKSFQGVSEFPPPSQKTIKDWFRSQSKQDFNIWYHSKLSRAIRVSLIMFAISSATINLLLLLGYEISTMSYLLLGTVTTSRVVLFCFTCTKWYTNHFQTAAMISRIYDSLILLLLWLQYLLGSLGDGKIVILFIIDILASHLFTGRFLHALFISIIQAISITITIIMKGSYEIYSSLTMLFICLLICVYVHYNSELHYLHHFDYDITLNQRTSKIQTEKSISDNLLLSIVPYFILDRFQNDQLSRSKYLSFQGNVTILIADLVGFTSLCSTRQASQVVEILNEIFEKFDQLGSKYHITKVKTLGDAVVFAGNVEESLPDHAEVVTDLGLEMINCLSEFNQRTNDNIAIRIGISTGPIWAGIVRMKRFSFDVWGSTYLEAERAQMKAPPGKICITQSTWEIIKEKYQTDQQQELTDSTNAIDMEGNHHGFIVTGKILNNVS